MHKQTTQNILPCNITRVQKKKKTSFVVESAWIKQIYHFATWFEERLCKLSTRNYKIHHIVKFVSKIEYTKSEKDDLSLKLLCV